MHPGSLREFSALFWIISKNSAIRLGSISASTTTANGLAVAAILVVDEKLLLDDDDDAPPRVLVIRNVAWRVVAKERAGVTRRRRDSMRNNKVVAINGMVRCRC